MKWTLEERFTVYFLITLYPDDAGWTWERRARVFNNIYADRKREVDTIKYDYEMRHPNGKGRTKDYQDHIIKLVNQYSAEEMQDRAAALAHIVRVAGQMGFDATPAIAAQQAQQTAPTQPALGTKPPSARPAPKAPKRKAAPKSSTAGILEDAQQSRRSDRLQREDQAAEADVDPDSMQATANEMAAARKQAQAKKDGSNIEEGANKGETDQKASGPARKRNKRTADKLMCEHCKKSKKSCDINQEGRPCQRCRNAGRDWKECNPEPMYEIDPRTGEAIGITNEGDRVGAETDEKDVTVDPEAYGRQSQLAQKKQPARPRKAPTAGTGRRDKSPDYADNPAIAGRLEQKGYNVPGFTINSPSASPKTAQQASIHEQSVSLNQDMDRLTTAYPQVEAEVVARVFVACNGDFAMAFANVNAMGFQPVAVPEEAGWTAAEVEATGMNFVQRKGFLAINKAKGTEYGEGQEDYAPGDDQGEDEMEG